MYTQKVPNDDTLMKAIVIKADEESSWIEDGLDRKIDYKLKVNGISMEEIDIERNESNVIKSCVVMISPILLKDLRSFTVILGDSFTNQSY